MRRTRNGPPASSVCLRRRGRRMLPRRVVLPKSLLLQLAEARLRHRRRDVRGRQRADFAGLRGGARGVGGARLGGSLGIGSFPLEAWLATVAFDRRGRGLASGPEVFWRFAIELAGLAALTAGRRCSITRPSLVIFPRALAVASLLPCCRILAARRFPVSQPIRGPARLFEHLRVLLLQLGLDDQIVLDLLDCSSVPLPECSVGHGSRRALTLAEICVARRVGRPDLETPLPAVWAVGPGLARGGFCVGLFRWARRDGDAWSRKLLGSCHCAEIVG